MSIFGCFNLDVLSLVAGDHEFGALKTFLVKVIYIDLTCGLLFGESSCVLPGEEIARAVSYVGVEWAELEAIEVAIDEDGRVILGGCLFLKSGLNSCNRFAEIIVMINLNAVGVFANDRSPEQAYFFIVRKEKMFDTLS